MVCPKCARILPDIAKYCDRCGTATGRGMPYIHMKKDGTFLRIDDRGILVSRFDRSAQKVLAKELHLPYIPFAAFLRSRKHKLYKAFSELSENAPDILANMTGGKFYPEADIVTVHLLYYPGNPDVNRLYPRNYLACLLPDQTVHIELPFHRRMELPDFQPIMQFFPNKHRGMLVIKEPLTQ